MSQKPAPKVAPQLAQKVALVYRVASSLYADEGRADQEEPVLARHPGMAGVAAGAAGIGVEAAAAANAALPSPTEELNKMTFCDCAAFQHYIAELHNLT